MIFNVFFRQRTFFFDSFGKIIFASTKNFFLRFTVRRMLISQTCRCCSNFFPEQHFSCSRKHIKNLFEWNKQESISRKAVVNWKASTGNMIGINFHDDEDDKSLVVAVAVINFTRLGRLRGTANWSLKNYLLKQSQHKLAKVFKA